MAGGVIGALIDSWFRVAVVVIVIAVTYWFVETYPVTAALFGLAAFGLLFLISANNNRTTNQAREAEGSKASSRSHFN
jgi:ATP/ADP translocase